MNLNSLEINHDDFSSMSSPNFRLSGWSLGYWTACNNFQRYCTLPYCEKALGQFSQQLIYLIHSSEVTQCLWCIPNNTQYDVIHTMWKGIRHCVSIYEHTDFFMPWSSLYDFEVWRDTLDVIIFILMTSVRIYLHINDDTFVIRFEYSFETNKPYVYADQITGYYWRMITCSPFSQGQLSS